MNPTTQYLQSHLNTLATPEGRMVGTPGHLAAQTYLEQQLRDLGCEPYAGDSFVLPYRKHGQDFFNVVGVLRGTDRNKAPVLIGPHYDSVIEAPCADDNAAAVAIGIEMVRMLSEAPLERDVVLAFFDAEEPPYFLSEQMGSIRFYHDQMDERGVHAAVIMDLVGHAVDLPFAAMAGPEATAPGSPLADLLKNLRNLLFATGAESHPDIAEVLHAVGFSEQLPLICAPNRVVGDLGDHAVFREQGVPYLFLSCGRWEHYHQVTDTPDRLDYDKMALITHYGTQLVNALGSAQLDTPPDRDAHTLNLEIRCVEQALGPILPLLLDRLGLSKLESRQDLDAFADGLLAFGL